MSKLTCTDESKKEIEKSNDFFAPFLRAENQLSALFPGKRAERRRKIIFRPFSRKKGGKLIFRLVGRRRAEGGFYLRPINVAILVAQLHTLWCVFAQLDPLHFNFIVWQ